MDRTTRERAQQELLRSIEKEVYEQQVANVKAIQRQLDQLDTTDEDFDVQRAELAMHRLNRSAVAARQHAWRGFHRY